MFPPLVDPEQLTLFRIRRSTNARSSGSPAGRSSARSATRGTSTSAPAAVERVARLPPNSTGITGSYVPCAIAIGGNGDSRSGSQPSTVGMKPESAISAAVRGRPCAEPERIAHHRALREPSEHDLVGRERQRVEPLRQRAVAFGERLAGRGSRRAGRRTSGRRRAAARAARGACCRAGGARGRARRAAGRGRARRRRGRGGARARPPARRRRGARARAAQRAASSPRADSGSGVSIGSIWARRCSNAGGRMSVSPRCAGSSSIAKPGPERRDLEQDAARLAEVDRAEPEAVDDLGRAAAGVGDAVAPRLLLLHRRRPRDVVHGAGAGDAGSPAPPRTRSSRRATRRASPSGSPSARSRARRGTARCRVEIARVRADALEALQRELGGISGWSAIERLVGHGRDDELVPQPFRVGERDACRRRARRRAGRPRSRAPPRSRRARRPCAPSRAGAAGRAPGYSKNVMSAPGLPCSSA